MIRPPVNDAEILIWRERISRELESMKNILSPVTSNFLEDNNGEILTDYDGNILES